MAGKSEPLDPTAPVSLSLEARVENAALARRAIATEAARAGLANGATNAAQVVVTEGFTNAARYAAETEEAGRIQVHAEADSDGITVVVRDSGAGFHPRMKEGGAQGGAGLALIAALADRLQLRRLPEGGTEISARIGTRFN